MMYEMQRRGRWRLAVACLAAVMVLGACNGDADEGDTTSTSVAGTAADETDEGDGPAGDTVQIGLLEPLSGPFADHGEQARLGAELCVEQVNAAGGIEELGGAQLELVIQDTGPASPAQVANLLQGLIDQNDPSAIIGAWASSYTLSASTVAEQAEIPMLSESFSEEITARGYEYIFKIPADANVMGTSAVDQVLALAEQSGYDISTVAVAVDNTSAARVSGEAAAEYMEELGLEVSALEVFPPDLTDASSLALTVLAGDPQLIFVQGALPDMALLQGEFREQGYEGPVLGAGSGFVATDYATTIGEAAEGAFSSAAWNWDLPGEAATQFFDDFTSAYPDFAFPGQEAGQTCSFVYLIAAAISEAGSADPLAIRDALASIEIESGPATMLVPETVSFDDTGQLENTSPVIVQWQYEEPGSDNPEELRPRTVAPDAIASTDPVLVNE